ncbi:asparagine synthetase AsnA [Spiroplasma syrphidicola EA-1]|uniref:Asparagine synthetase AsnA n=1 Tax=Spiroplasma syrphidicola EA-1 TaxID=1276229 RepID=R4U4Y3_9MOLU|nr:asparagine synthetase AsnA [Spiroplasma syrphidicola]AGM25618.1 asparagine synthetase AsnA [Spiroplasma syrphidicola EA-1]
MAFKMQIGYSSILNPRETVTAISETKNELIKNLKTTFKLLEVEPAIICREETGLNDDFRISERPIDFDILPSNLVGEILQTHNKWRRSVIQKYDILNDEGILTVTNPLRRDIVQSINQAVVCSEIGFDILVEEKQLTMHNLEQIVKKLVKVIYHVEDNLLKTYPQLNRKFSEKTNWVNYNELVKSMRLLTYQERIDKYTRENGPVILYGLQDVIKNGSLDLNESFDVVDWELYTKIFVYDFILEKAICVGYCAASVGKEALKRQLAVTKEIIKIRTNYDAKLAKDELPPTITCGIYKTQLDLLLLEKQHIAEVVPSIWEDDFLEYVNKNGIEIL